MHFTILLAPCISENKCTVVHFVLGTYSTDCGVPVIVMFLSCMVCPGPGSIVETYRQCSIENIHNSNIVLKIEMIIVQQNAKTIVSGFFNFHFS